MSESATEAYVVSPEETELIWKCTLTLCGGNEKLARLALSKRRQHKLVMIRRELAEALRKAGWSYPHIGRVLGRDHSTIIHLLKTDPEELKTASLEMTSEESKEKK